MQTIRTFQEFSSKGISAYAYLSSGIEEIDKAASGLLSILQMMYPEKENHGILQENSHFHGHILSIIPDERNTGPKSILFVLSTCPVWGTFTNLLALAQNNTLKEGFAYSPTTWRRHIENMGRVFPTPENIRSCFITNKIRYRRLAQRGLLRFAPWLMKAGSHMDKHSSYGASYGVDFFRRLDQKVYKEVESRLSDQRSKDLYRLVLTGKAEDLWRHYFHCLTDTNQYQDYITINEETSILNFGIHTGTEIPLFLSYSPKQVYYIDPAGFSYIDPYPQAWIDRSTSVNHFIDCGVWPENIDLEPSSALGEQVSVHYISDAKQAKQSSKAIKLRTMGKIIAEFGISKIDFMKFDLEGAEEHIVDLLEETIKRFRPQIAMSIYHGNDHYTHIPLKLMNMCENYSFHIGHYSYESPECILYCIPK